MGDEAGHDEPTDGTGKPSARERLLEFVAVSLLGLAALATAWSGYQASLWDGIQSSNYTQASGARTNAAQQRTEANQIRIADLTLFENHIDALLDGDDELADFYLQRFPPSFAAAYEAWMALDPLENPDAPASPLAMSEYQLAPDQEAEALELRADAFFTDGRPPTLTPTSTPCRRCCSPWSCSSPPSPSGSRCSRCGSPCWRSPQSGWWSAWSSRSGSRSRADETSRSDLIHPMRS